MLTPRTQQVGIDCKALLCVWVGVNALTYSPGMSIVSLFYQSVYASLAALIKVCKQNVK